MNYGLETKFEKKCIKRRGLTMQIPHSIKNIETIIEMKRKELIEIGLKHGFSSSLTLNASQKLDELILQYQKCNQ